MALFLLFGYPFRSTEIVGQALESSEITSVKEVQVMIGLAQEQLWYQLVKEKETQISALASRVAALEAIVQGPATPTQSASFIAAELFLGALLLASLIVWLKGQLYKGGRS